MIGLLSLNLVACKRQKRIERKLHILEEEIARLHNKSMIVKCKCLHGLGNKYHARSGLNLEDAKYKIHTFCQENYPNFEYLGDCIY